MIAIISNEDNAHISTLASRGMYVVAYEEYVPSTIVSIDSAKLRGMGRRG